MRQEPQYLPNGGVTKLQSGMEMTRVPQGAIQQAWPLVEPFVEEALAHTMGEFSAHDVLAILKRGYAQLWLILAEDKSVQAVAVTDIVQMPQRTVCTVWLCAGNLLEDWEDAIQVIEAWATHHGCDLVKAVARRGWSRAARRRGFTTVQEAYFKSLVGNQQ